MATLIDCYCPLTATSCEIRLLRVDRNPTKIVPGEVDLVQCSIEYISLDSDPIRPYTAISYCWGNETQRGPILLNGQNVTAPKSALSALKNLAHQEVNLFWIDAICINQADRHEKAQQVGMIKDIYSEATEVRIWLGFLDNGVAQRAIDSATTIYKQCMRVTNNTVDLQAYLNGTDGSPGFKYSDEALPMCDWEALRTLYSLPWFTRLWVVQEIALARKAVFQIGVHSVPADTITLAARWMVHRRYAKHFGNSEVEGIESASSMYKPSLRPLSNQLRRMHRQRCTDPRDRIYGLLGILQPQITAAIVPDYTLSLAQVYSSALRIAFEEDQSLDLLQFVAWYVEEPTARLSWTSVRNVLGRVWSRVKGTSVINRWPSWVLKLHATTDSSWGSCLNIQTFGKSHWPLEVRKVRDPWVLSVKGVVCSGISYSSGSFSKETLQKRQQLAKVMLQCLERIERLGLRKAAYTNWDDTILTFMCGIDHRNQQAVVNDDLIVKYDAFITWCQSANDWPGTDEEDDSGYPEYWYNLWRLMNRRFFITESGLLGMAPMKTRLGDYVCVISGSHVPFVLRKQGTRWKLIGDAYCRRLMATTTHDAVFDQAPYKLQGEWLDIH